MSNPLYPTTTRPNVPTSWKFDPFGAWVVNDIYIRIAGVGSLDVCKFNIQKADEVFSKDFTGRKR
jgi:hypothetical protein